MKKLSDSLNNLLETFQRLRDPNDGCPWDREQDFKSIADCTLEEAYEVVDAIDRENYEDLKSELGDLLFQIVFHAGMAEESGKFNLQDVIEEITSKLTRRHPHIFGDKVANTPEESLMLWEQVKAEERKNKNMSSLLDDVPRNLPSLARAKKLQKRAGTVGFDWKDENKVIAKIDEEIAELKAELASKDENKIQEEIGDIFFTLVNLCRHLGYEPEDIVKKSNNKFESRFRAMEQIAKEKNDTLNSLNLVELENLWIRAKNETN